MKRKKERGKERKKERKKGRKVEHQRVESRKSRSKGECCWIGRWYIEGLQGADITSRKCRGCH